MEQEKEWIEKYLADPADIFTGRCVPEATGLLDKLIDEAEARGRKKGIEECVERIAKTRLGERETIETETHTFRTYDEKMVFNEIADLFMNRLIALLARKEGQK